MSEKNGQVKKNVPHDNFLLHKKGCHTNAKRTISVRGLLFVTACLPLSNAAIFTCVLL